MRSLRPLALGCVLLLISFALSTAYGDEWNQKTVLKLTEPMQIQGVLLQPGTYILKLMDSMADRHIVRIMNEDETEIIATVIASPHYELRPPNRTQMNFWETPAVTPPAAKTWHYPGEMLGLEFRQPPPSQVAATPEPVAPPIAEAPPALEPEAPIAEAPIPPVPETAETPPASTSEAPAPLQSLPKTASRLPLIAMIGLAFLALSILFRGLRAAWGKVR